MWDEDVEVGGNVARRKLRNDETTFLARREAEPHLPAPLTSHLSPLTFRRAVHCISLPSTSSKSPLFAFLCCVHHYSRSTSLPEKYSPSSPSSPSSLFGRHAFLITPAVANETRFGSYAPSFVSSTHQAATLVTTRTNLPSAPGQLSQICVNPTQQTTPSSTRWYRAILVLEALNP